MAGSDIIPSYGNKCCLHKDRVFGPTGTPRFRRSSQPLGIQEFAIAFPEEPSIRRCQSQVPGFYPTDPTNLGVLQGLGVAVHLRSPESDPKGRPRVHDSE